jgi:hypothetical protein
LRKFLHLKYKYEKAYFIKCSNIFSKIKSKNQKQAKIRTNINDLLYMGLAKSRGVCVGAHMTMVIKKQTSGLPPKLEVIT